MKGMRCIYTPSPKLAVTGLSSGDSEDFFGDSGQLSSGDSTKLQRLRTCSETCKHSVETKISGDSGKIFGHSENTVVSTPKISQVMCECKGVSHGFVRSS
jgi:hypothetical protein